MAKMGFHVGGMSSIQLKLTYNEFMVNIFIF